MTDSVTTLYRITDCRFLTSMDENCRSSRAHLSVTPYPVLKETPCGYWIDDDRYFEPEIRRWVSKNSLKKYAYPSLEEAFVGYRARKTRQLQILEARLKHVRECLTLPIPKKVDFTST